MKKTKSVAKKKSNNLVTKLKMFKDAGFQFQSLYVRGSGRWTIRLIKQDMTVDFNKSMTEANIDATIEDANDAIKNRANSAKRSSMINRMKYQSITGGMAWAPSGIKTGIPQGKLALVKRAA